MLWRGGRKKANAYQQVKDFYDDEKGAVQQVSKVVVATGSEVGSIAISGGVLTQTSYEPFNQFLLLRVVETWALPGETLAAERYDEQKGAVQATSRLLATTGSEASTLAAVGAVVTKTDYTPINAYVVRRVSEEWTAPGPLVSRDVYEDDKGAIHETTQLILISGTPAGSFAASGSTVTQTRYEPVDAVTVRRIITTWTVDGPALVSQQLNEDGTLSTLTKTIRKVGDITEGETLSGGVWTKTERQAINAYVAVQLVTARPVPGNELSSEILTGKGQVATRTKTLVAAAGAAVEASALV
jgi:hypothetical protein